MIELKDICKSYYGQGIENKVLRHIDCKIEAGEFVMLYGESGSGKTTLLNMIGLLDSCTSGQILLNGENITNLAGDEQAKLRNQTFGYVFQSFYLIPELNVMENVCLPAGYAGKKKKEMVRRADTLLQEVCAVQTLCCRKWDWRIRKSCGPLNCQEGRSKGWP